MSIEKDTNKILFAYEQDPDTEDWRMEVHVSGRLGMCAGVLETLLIKQVLPAAERFDPEGLISFQRLADKSP